LRDELQTYPISESLSDAAPLLTEDVGVAIALRFITPAGILSFLSTTTVFGTPLDITLSELAIEAFFPADARTAEALRAIAAAKN
jgi:hypothetical protein